jgi:hypothetical protein
VPRADDSRRRESAARSELPTAASKEVGELELLLGRRLGWQLLGRLGHASGGQGSSGVAAAAGLAALEERSLFAGSPLTVFGFGITSAGATDSGVRRVTTPPITSYSAQHLGLGDGVSKGICNGRRLVSGVHSWDSSLACNDGLDSRVDVFADFLTGVIVDEGGAPRRMCLAPMTRRVNRLLPSRSASSSCCWAGGWGGHCSVVSISPVAVPVSSVVAGAAGLAAQPCASSADDSRRRESASRTELPTALQSRSANSSCWAGGWGGTCSVVSNTRVAGRARAWSQPLPVWLRSALCLARR